MDSSLPSNMPLKRAQWWLKLILIGWFSLQSFLIVFCQSQSNFNSFIYSHAHSYSGHSMSDPGTSYRSRDEVQGVRQSRDPINLFKERIISTELATADEIKKIDDTIKKAVDAATKFCKVDKEIGLEELYTDVYSKNLVPLIRGILPDTLHKHNTLNKAVNL